MGKYHIIPVVFWLALGLFVIAISHALRLGNLHNPGPGLFPFLVGLLLLSASSCALIKSLVKKETALEAVKEVQNERRLGRLSGAVVSLFAYGLFFETLGYLIATCIILILLFWSMGSRKWAFVVGFSIFIAFLTYFGFTFLGVRFPKGILTGLLG
jgi:putative tricarboxylic transport membrane protein